MEMVSVKRFIFIFSVVVLSYAGAQECQPNKIDEETVTLEKLLHNSILCNYEPSFRPVLQHSTLTNLTTEIFVSSLQTSYDRSAIDTVSMEVDLALSWRDEFLIWDPNLYGGIEETVIPSSKIWYPRLSVMNVHFSYESEFSSPCIVKSTGHVSCSGEFSFAAKCVKTFKYWPYDRHNCIIHFGLWMYNEDSIVVNLSDSKVSVLPTFHGKTWSLLDIELVEDDERLSYVYFSNILVNFTIQRSPEEIDLLGTFVIPIVFILMATISTILMEIESFEKVLVVILNIYLNMDFLANIMNQLPAVEEELAIAVVYTRQTFMLACAILINTVLTRYFAGKSTEPPKQITQVIGFMDSGVGKIIMFRAFDTSFFAASFLDDLESLTEDKIKPAVNSEWNRFAHILNRVFGICVCVTYFFLLLQFAM